MKTHDHRDVSEKTQSRVVRGTGCPLLLGNFADSMGRLNNLSILKIEFDIQKMH